MSELECCAPGPPPRRGVLYPPFPEIEVGTSEMARERDQTYGRQRVTLRQTLVVALLLHLILAGVAQWRPDLLWPSPAVAQEPDRARPLEFRFVDVPETESPEETPDTELLSDRDRQARDASERDDSAEPYSEGNTSQEVLRTPPATATPASQPRPETPPVEAETSPAEPAEEPRPEVTEEASPEETEAPEPEGTEPRPAPGEESGETTSARPPVRLPPSRPDLRSTMSRMTPFVDTEVHDNRNGGADGEPGLVSFDTKGYELGPYINEVLRIIERNWKMNIPSAASLPGMEGATFVRLSIRRFRGADGEETAEIVVHRTWTSGKRSFDQAAIFALDISNPLPPIPSFFPYDSLDGRIGFLYNLRPDEVTFPPGG